MDTSPAPDAELVESPADAWATPSLLSSDRESLMITERVKFKTDNAVEIGTQAVWSVSSCKPGYGVKNLRDNSLDTYWQSDGIQPHLINIEFTRKTVVRTIRLFADYKQDESYTPSKISVRCGTNFHDLQKVTTVELEEPEGWVDVDIFDENEKPMKAFLFQVAVLSNHQNGRDTHIRQVKVFEPKWTTGECSGSRMEMAEHTDWQSIEFTSMLSYR